MESQNENNKETVEVLNDLIQINNDRIEGYHKAAEELKDADGDLKSLFNNMASESSKYKQELTQHVSRLGGEPAKDTTVSGKIYRAWMDVKATFTGKDRGAVLASCEFGEDAAQKAYDMALAADGHIGTDARQLIQQQNQRCAAPTTRSKSIEICTIKDNNVF